MIVNGRIYIENTTIENGDTLDESGDPVENAIVWLNTPIPCLFRPIKHDLLGKYEDGKYTRSSYDMLIEQKDFKAKRLKLVNDRDVELGIFEIQDIEYLNVVSLTKITV